jgi:hypothetical protein
LAVGEGVMDRRESIEELRARAARCRELAGTATDAEVAQTLRETAKDMDAAIAALTKVDS